MSDERFPPPPGLPESLVPSTTTQTTQPAPDPIVEALHKLLEPHLQNIFGQLAGIQEQLRGLNNGVGAAHRRIGELDGKLDQVLKAATDAGNATLTLNQSVVDLRDGIAKQSTFDKERLAAVERAAAEAALQADHVKEKVEDLGPRVERLEAASK